MTIVVTRNRLPMTNLALDECMGNFAFVQPLPQTYL